MRSPPTPSLSILMTRSGKAVMNPCAAAVIAVRPTEGLPSLIFSEPPSAKNAATLGAFWLHQAAVYRVANSCSWAGSMGFLVNQSHEFRNCRNFRHWLIAVPGPAPYFSPTRTPESSVGGWHGLHAQLVVK